MKLKLEGLPIEIHSIQNSSSSIIKGHFEKHVYYTVNKGFEDEVDFEIILPAYQRREKSDKVISASKEFINGFKLVQTSNGELAYIREEDYALLPYRYDIASDFNEYGFAMAGKEGHVTWINKDFKCLNIHGKFCDENELYTNEEPYTWSQTGYKITEFSKGKIPLAKISTGREISTGCGIFYIDKNGKVKEFKQYYGEEKGVSNYGSSSFRKGTDFNEQGYAFKPGDDKILLATGYYITLENLLNISLENGTFDQIVRETSKDGMPKQKNKNPKTN